MSNHRPTQLPVDLFPPEVITESGAPEHVTGRLYPEEAAFVSNAVPKRQREFRAGRVLARGVLQQLGINDYPLLMNDDRRPVWPRGVVGSISHADGICGVAVARKDRIRGLGLDIEVADAVSSEIRSVVLTEAELAWVNRQSESPRWAGLIFSAKEAAYKALCSVQPMHLEFTDLQVRVESSLRQFEVALAGNTQAPSGVRFPMTGYFRFEGPWVFTGIVIRDTRSGVVKFANPSM